MWSFDVKVEAGEFKSAFRIIPAGWHKFTILTGEIKGTKSGGQQLCLTMQCAGGEFVDRLNVVNSSAKAQSIGISQLAKICQCVGIDGRFTPDRVPELFGRELDVKVDVEEFESNKDNKMLQSNKAADYAQAGEKSSMGNAMARPATTDKKEKLPW
jgi:hypothetical protein